jgi:hypothetical protein
MSAGVCGNDNRTTDNDLSYTLQSACSFSLDGNNELVRQESDQRNEYEQSGKPCESNKCICDPGSNATCTCTGATTIDRSTIGHTSFPCNHCGDHIGNADLVRKHKYTVHPTIADHVERDYTDYINATSSKGQDTRSGVWGSDEPRNIKQADAESSDSVERRTGIPAGVTI